MRKPDAAATGAALVHESVLVFDDVDEPAVENAAAGRTHGRGEHGAACRVRTAGVVVHLRGHGTGPHDGDAGVSAGVADVLDEAHVDGFGWEDWRLDFVRDGGWGGYKY